MKKYYYLTLIFTLALLFLGTFLGVKAESDARWMINKISISHSPVVMGGDDWFFIEGEIVGQVIKTEEEAKDLESICVREMLYCPSCEANGKTGYEVGGGTPQRMEDARFCCLGRSGNEPDGRIRFQGTCNFAWKENIKCMPAGTEGNPIDSAGNHPYPDCDPTKVEEWFPDGINFEVRLIDVTGKPNEEAFQANGGDDGRDIVARRSFNVPVIGPSGADVFQKHNDQPTMLDPIVTTSVPEFLEYMARIIFWIVSSFAFVMIIVGGLMMVTSAGDPKRTTRGRNTVLFAILGFAIVSISRGIVALVQAIMGAKNSG